MRTLIIHSDYIKFKVKKKAIGDAEEVSEKEGAAVDALVAFIAVEKVDEKDPDSVVVQTISEIKGLYEKVGAKSVAVYPYAHLSDNLSSPKTAKVILDGVYEKLKSEGYEVIKAPFGWYKSFEIKCKGHPLSELSRTIVPGTAKVKDEKEKESDALKSEEKLKSYWYILDVCGTLTPADKFNYSGHDNLKKFSDYEISGTRAVDKIPPHVKFMRLHEIADYEPGSDPGNMRWYPKGSLIKRLLEEKVSAMVAKMGGMQVETPIMYDYLHENLSKYLNRFPARQYVVKSGEKEYFLRFAACFGQYLMKHDMTISYKNLPLKLYELSHYSFRREQKGELVGLRRLRAFTMPDMHTLASDMDGAKNEFLEQFRASMQWMRDLGIDYEVGIRFVKDFYYENEEFAKKLVQLIGRPVLIEMWDERPFYFVMKFEFNFVDALNKASALSTVQIDIENTKRFDISYTDDSGNKRYPLMLHASISGSIDRNIYAILEKCELDMRRGKKPTFPLWLSPTQIRVIPVSENFVSFAEEILNKINDSNIRADLDDRVLSMGKKIRDAEKEWIPYIAVIGEKEEGTGELSVRIRETGKQENMTVDNLINDIKEKTGGLPFKPLPVPKLLSKRAKFV